MTNIPLNKKLYNKIKSKVKRKFRVWPSAYASGFLVREYKKMGGTYTKSKTKSRRKSKTKSRRKSKVKSRRKSKVKSRRKSKVKSRRKSKTKSRRKSKRKSKTKSRRKSKTKSRRKSKVKSRRKSRRKSKTKSRRKSESGLSRWFSEEWIDVCKLPDIVKCGRKNTYNSKRKYPYCRPRYKISDNSPRTASSLSKKEIRSRCKSKRKSPYKKVTKLRKNR
jgi:hypothetical protein